MENISNPIYIKHELNHLFTVKSTFSWYAKVDEVYHRLIKVKILDEEAWSDLCDYQEEHDKED